MNLMGENVARQITYFSLKTKTPLNIIAFIVSVVFGGIASWRAGHDINWDWQNYHDYNVWALINGRLWIDVAPASIQTYLNPVVLIPDYAFRTLLPIPIGSIVAGAMQALALGFIWLISARLFDRVALMFASMVIAISGPMLLAEIGTSFPDLLSSTPILAAIYLLISPENCWRKVFGAGILIGVSVGLKLTNAPYAIGACSAILLSTDRIRASIFLYVGGAVGGLLAAGPWAMLMWQEFGNPVFPFYNGMFGSPEGPSFNFYDDRFLPKSLGEWIAYPFMWLAGQHTTTEVPFRDARFAILAVLIPFLIGVNIGKKTVIFTRCDCIFFVFFGVSYVTWSIMFSIHRYAISLELLAGPVIVLILARTTAGATRSAASLATAAIVLVTSVPADWGHRKWDDPYVPPSAPGGFRQPATFFMLDVPTSYIVRHLPEGSRFFSLAARYHLPIAEGGKFDTRIKAELSKTPRDDLWTISIKGARNNLDGLARYGLKVDALRQCRTAKGPSVDVEFCPLASL